MKIVAEERQQVGFVLVEARVAHITDAEDLVDPQTDLSQHEVSLVHFLFFATTPTHHF